MVAGATPGCVGSVQRLSGDSRRIETGEGQMKSPVVKRSIVIAGHKTSVSLEDAFWQELKAIAGGRDMSLSALVAAIDSGRQQRGNLSSAIRLFVLDFYRAQFSENPDVRAIEPGAPRPRLKSPAAR